MKHFISFLLVLTAFTSSVNANQARIIENYGKIPIAFMVNRGQYELFVNHNLL